MPRHAGEHGRPLQVTLYHLIASETVTLYARRPNKTCMGLILSNLVDLVSLSTGRTLLYTSEVVTVTQGDSWQFNPGGVL